MALFSPCYTQDLLPRKRPQIRQRTKTTNAPMTSVKVAPGKEGTSLDSLLDKHQRMLLLRTRRQESRCKRRSCTMLAPSPRYPVITEMDEDENDDEAVAAAVAPTQEFTTADQTPDASSVMTPITTIPEASEEEFPSGSDTTSSSKSSKTKSVLSRFNAWVRGHSFKKRKNDSDKENGRL